MPPVKLPTAFARAAMSSLLLSAILPAPLSSPPLVLAVSNRRLKSVPPKISDFGSRRRVRDRIVHRGCSRVVSRR